LDKKGTLLRSVGAKQSVGSGQGLGNFFCKTECHSKQYVSDTQFM